VFGPTANSKMLEFFKRILGISNLENRTLELEKKLAKVESNSKEVEVLSVRMSKLEEGLKKRSKASPEVRERDKKEILKALVGQMTTRQVAKKIGKSRSWVSLLINRLEKEGKVVEAEKKGKKVLYEKSS
tara:strand:+ start:111 stop:500 length:390 start_codon:yes stop_codon:yes gene_type:complete